MSLTKVLNSKVNIKQASVVDFSATLKQPAIARYAAEQSYMRTEVRRPRWH